MLNFLPALAELLETPASSLTRIRRALPAASGGPGSVGADRAGDAAPGRGDELGDALRERAAVGVAEADEHGAGLGRGFDGLEAVLHVRGGAVEEVFGVVDDLAAEACQVGDRIADH